MTISALIGATVAFGASPYVAHAAVETDDRTAAALGICTAVVAGCILAVTLGYDPQSGAAVGVVASLAGVASA